MKDVDLDVPRIIYSLWLQGIGEAPAIVRLVFRCWSALNPDYELRILDQGDVERLLPDFKLKPGQMTPQALSDVMRARVLLGGGVWVDASVLPVQPLGSWLPALLRKSGFFAFERPAPDRPLSSWFMAASRDHVLVKKLWREVERYWSKPRNLASYRDGPIPSDPVWEVAPTGGAATERFPYFWFHYLFRYLLETDADFAYHWDRCDKLSAIPQTRLQALFAGRDIPSRQAIFEAIQGAPVHKLNWRHAYPVSVFESLVLPAPYLR